MLHEFGRGGSLARLLTAPTLDMKSLLAACLGRVETKLRMVPDILGVRFPQYRDDAIESSEDEELVWVQDEQEGPLASWGDGHVDLAACCAQTCASADQAVFRLKAFVHYCGKPEQAPASLQRPLRRLLPRAGDLVQERRPPGGRAGGGAGRRAEGLPLHQLL